MSANKLLQAAAGNAAGEAVYVEDVFSTYLYEGNGSTQTITNGIDLVGEGGMVWTKERSPNARNHFIGDSARDNFRNYLYANLTNAASGLSGAGFDISSVSSSGYSLGADNYTLNNESGSSQVSWTFRKQAGFFDVVTWSGDGVQGREIAHDLAANVGTLIIKKTNNVGSWYVWHRSQPGKFSRLETITQFLTDTGTVFGNGSTAIAPTSNSFTVDTLLNEVGDDYVAYVFAHDDQSFGDNSDESIIKCGSYTGNGSTDGPTVTLGFEPQWLMIRGTSGGDWQILDNMRGIHSGGTNDARLLANSSAAEYNSIEAVQLQATGFKIDGTTGGAFNSSGNTFIYIAIRRPMKTPESGTEVFSPQTYTGDGTNSKTFTGAGFPPDLVINNDRTRTNTRPWFDRLRGGKQRLTSTAASVESVVDYGVQLFDTMDGYIGGTGDANTFGFNASSITYANYYFKRATGFFDVVAYTGDGAATQTLNHNLGVTPDIIVVKKRSTSGSQWPIIITSTTDTMYLNTTNASFGAFYYIDNPTSTTFDVQTDGSAPQSNQSGETYIAYLFATLAGVSKVGSYTGTGTTNNIDCGFSSSARFVMVKRTSSTGDWYVWDSARGITVGSDPFLKINTTDAEGTTSDIIQPYSSGFTLTSNAGTAINGSGSSFIFLAIA